MGGGGVEVAAEPAPAGERGQGVPVAGDGLVAPGGFCAALADVVRPVHVEVAGEQQDLFLVVPQPAGEGVSGVVPGVPVPEPVVDAPGFRGLVVAFAQAGEDLRVECGAAAGAGVLDGPVRLAQEGDDVPGPVLHAAGAEFLHGPRTADDVLAALLDPGDPAQEVLVAGAAVGVDGVRSDGAAGGWCDSWRCLRNNWWPVLTGSCSRRSHRSAVVALAIDLLGIHCQRQHHVHQRDLGRLAMTVNGDVLALDIRTGRILWRRNFPQRVPTLLAATGSVLYAAEKNGTLYALSPRTGQELWRHSLPVPGSQEDQLLYLMVAGSNVIAADVHQLYAVQA